MKRMAILAALAGAFLIGCGAEDSPRFVPAGPDAGGPSRPSPGDANRTATPPKNIATH